MPDLEVFCRQVRSRSAENRRAILLMESSDLRAVAVGILRQELDSMVRVIYLLSVEDRVRRASLITASVAGSRWRGPSGRRITDREMVALSERLHGWTGSVYRFGCAFIHLSAYHDYRDRDPMAMLSAKEREDIVSHLRRYHGGPKKDHPTFEEVIRFAPFVFEKVASNLEHYIAELEADANIDLES